MKRSLIFKMIAVLLLVSLAGCVKPPSPAPSPGGETSLPGRIVLATTTSTYDSGLLTWLLPLFESQTGIKVDVISVGTGQAMEIGRLGECDVLLVHARELEDAFVKGGFGTERWDVMYNDFIYLGPKAARSEVMGQGSLAEALSAMVSSMDINAASFLSRGDNSGTHNKEKSLWPLAGYPEFALAKWYLSLGQGMGETLVAANEMGAFTLADRGTYLAMISNLPSLEIVYEDDDSLFNPYGIIPVNPAKHPHVKHEAAMLLVEFFISDATQAMIAEFGVDKYGLPLFFPNAGK